MLLKPLDLTWAIQAQLPRLDFVLPGLIPGSLGLLVATGGTGKSFLALDCAVSLALGRPVAGGLFPARTPSKVVYLAAEETERQIAERLRGMLRLDEHTDAFFKNLILLPMSGENCRLVANGKRTELLKELTALSAGARLIILDPIRRLHNGEENDSADMTQLVIAFESLAKSTGAAVLGLHHANRASASDNSSQHASRGSTALVDGARWQINLSRMDEKTADAFGVSDAERISYIALDFAKANYLPPRSRCWLKRQIDGGLTLTELAKPKTKGKTLGGARML